MTANHFLWPKNNIRRALSSIPRITKVSALEGMLSDLFLGGYPVLCSSGRVALVLALIESGMTRESLVGVFPYASHCVLDAIARVATPLAGSAAKSAHLRVVYHQWGFVQETELPSNSIEDCVDTLCIPGAALFPGGGRFEVWSLPKILGTTSGGILWCRDRETAKKISTLRDKRGGGNFQWLMRLLAGVYPKAHDYWQGAEGTLGKLGHMQMGEILVAISQWETTVGDRLNKLSLTWSRAVDWLPRPWDRLPPVVPMEPNLSETMIRSLGISSGYRMMERFNKQNGAYISKTMPLPIHQDTSIAWLEEILIILDKHKHNAGKI
ncbi:MAG: putative PLP-dependent aminotransferase [Legionella sp.]|nr:MAG: putative PLP-dependent aminotransferase [Legionella sp.]